MSGGGKKRARVVICGCGYGGVATAREFAQFNRGDIEVIAINDKPFLYQYPILPRLFLSPVLGAKICRSLPPLLDKYGAAFIQGRINRLNAADKTLIVNDEPVAFDYLVLATGARATPLEQDSGFQVYYPKAVKQLDALRGRFDKLDSQSTLRIVVVGGGLTGIEFAAAMRAYADRLPRPNATESIAVDLIEKEPRIAVDCLPSVSVTLHRQLEQTGIRVHTNTAVEKATREGVLCKDGTTRRADVVVSTIGCAPNLRFEHPDLSVAANGIETDQHLCCSQYNYIYAIGDVAKPPSHFEVRKRASSAIRMGRLAAHNICNDLRSRPLTSLQQRRQAVSVLTGERNALIAYGRHHFSGLSGYAVKLFLENHYA